MLFEIIHLWCVYSVSFERSGGDRGGASLPDHAETKHFDPWVGKVQIQVSNMMLHEASLTVLFYYEWHKKAGIFVKWTI